jgi:hypothetical protein
MAAAACSRQPHRLEDTGTKRSAFLVGAGVVVVLGVMGIAFKLFNASDESSTATTSVSVVGTPHYSPEVIKLVAETETALQQDDFKRARANVKTLQQIAPTHPRLSFFESLLRRHGDSSAAAPVVTSAPPRKGTTTSFSDVSQPRSANPRKFTTRLLLRPSHDPLAEPTYRTRYPPHEHPCVPRRLVMGHDLLRLPRLNMPLRRRALLQDPR